jgi:hypothetical protein
MARRSAELFLVAISLILIAILYTYPLIFNLSSLLPGFSESDTPFSVWNIWHLKQSLFTKHNFFSFTTDYIFFPQRPSLALHNYTITTGLLSLPFQYFFSPLVSRNIVFFLEFILSGLGIYLLVLHITKNRIAAWWSAVTLAFCPYVIVNSYHFLHFSGIWFFPWFLYLSWLFLDSGRLRYGVDAATVYALCLLNDQTYFFFLTVLLFLLWLFFPAKKNRPALKTYIKNSFIGVSVFLILTLPYLSALLAQLLKTKSGFPIWPDLCIDYFSLHPADLFRPPATLYLYRVCLYFCQPLDRITNVFAGYLPLFFAVFALLNVKDISGNARRMCVYCLAAAALFFLFSLGPIPFGKGNPLNSFLPYNYLFTGELFRQLRIPVRFFIVSLMGIYILAAVGVDRFIRLNKEKWVGNFTLGLFLIVLQVIEFLPAYYPLLNLEVPKAYYSLSRTDADAPVLVLPLGWQTSYKTVGVIPKKIQFYQTIHGQPIFQGQIARIDDTYLEYYTGQKGFRYLMEAASRLPAPGEEKEVHKILRKYGIRHVVIHRLYFNQAQLEALTRIFRDYQEKISLDFVP